MGLVVIHKHVKVLFLREAVLVDGDSGGPLVVGPLECLAFVTAPKSVISR